MSTDDPFLLTIADEMSDLADRLCRLACVLASDAALIEQHFDALQSIDLMTQIQRALAELLRRPGAPETRLAELPVEALAARLGARLAERRNQAA